MSGAAMNSIARTLYDDTAVRSSRRVGLVAWAALSSVSIAWRIPSRTRPPSICRPTTAASSITAAVRSVLRATFPSCRASARRRGVASSVLSCPVSAIRSLVCRSS